LDLVTRGERPCFRSLGVWPRSAPQFWGFSCIYALYILQRRTTKFNVVAYAWDGRISSGQQHLASQESGVLALHNFRGSYAKVGRGVSTSSTYILSRRTINRHGNTYGMRRVFTRTATPLRLDKCVARFDRDS